MKTFIATISYFSNYYGGGSTIKNVEASTKAVAQKRAEKYAAERFDSYETRIVTVEELTPKKEAALREAFAAADEEYRRIRDIRLMLSHCISVSEGYRKI